MWTRCSGPRQFIRRGARRAWTAHAVTEPAERLDDIDVRALVAQEPAEPDDEPHVAGSLQRLCRAAARVLPASGAGVSVMSREGVPVTTAASDPTSAAVEELQFTVGEGPCLEAYSARRSVLVPDLDEDGGTRWPGYALAARDHGVRAVFAFALQVGAARLGVLDVYRGTSGVLSARSLRAALTFAQVAVEMLLDAQQRAVQDDRAPSLDDALSTGFELYQAQGMVMYQLDITLGEAMSRVRAYAFAHDQRLADVASGIVSRRIVLEEDGADGGDAPRQDKGS